MPGYQDYQRVVNWDNPAIVDEALVEREKETTLGRFDCSRFAYIMGKLQFTGSVMRVQIKWFLSETGGEPVGEREFYMDNLTPLAATFHIANLGPWVSIIYRPEVLATKYKVVAKLFLSNRVMPADATPRFPFVVDKQSIKVAAAGNAVVKPEMWWAGPARVWLYNPTGSALLNVEALLNGFTYEFVEQLGPLTATNTNVNINLPYTAWRLLLLNNAAAEGTFILTIIPAITGST